MSTLAKSAVLVIAEAGGRIAGAVGYVGPHVPKPAQFDPAWAIIRMLAVSPSARGCGVGSALTRECIRRAMRDRAGIIALHTSPFMTVALDMYRRIGFEPHKKGPPVFGALTHVYAKTLPPQPE